MMTRISLLMTALLLVLALPARADTLVSGNINTDTHWTTAGSPYVLQNDVAVVAAATLTIDPGVVVKANSTGGSGNRDSARIELVIQGRLIADASTGSPIVFTSAKASPVTGDWYGIDFLTTAVAGSVIKNVEIAYARKALHIENTPAANLALDKLFIHHFSENGVYLLGATTTVAVTNSEIHEQGVASPGSCIYMETVGNAVHSGLKLHHCSYGVYAYETSATIQDSQVYANTTQGLYLYRASATARTFELKNSLLYANGAYGAELYNIASGLLTLNVTDSVVFGHTSYGFYGGNSYYTPHVRYQYSDIWSNGSGATSGNTVDGTAGSMVENPLLVAPATYDFRPTERSPLRYSDSNTVKGTIGPLEYDGVTTPGMQGVYWTSTTFPTGETPIEGDVTVAKGAILTIPAGATLRMATTDAMKGGVDTARIEFLVKGTLSVAGTPTQQVTFTSTGTAKTDWYGIHVFPTADGLSMGGTKVVRATRGLWIDGTALAPTDLEADSCDTGLYVSGSNAAFANLTIHDGTTGIYATGGNPQFTNVALTNGTSGIVLTATQADFQDLTINGFTSYGVNISEGGAGFTNAFKHCLIYDNQIGFYLYNSSGAIAATLNHCTVAFNRGDAFNLYRTSNSYAMSVVLSASAVTNNTGYAFNGSSSYYTPTATWTYSDVWKNGSGVSASITGGASTGSFIYNPLYANPAARNFKPTHRSPLRYSDGAAAEIGYHAYGSDQTPGYHGFYWENQAFTPGTYEVAGDVVVTARRIPGSGVDPADPTDDVPARVTFQPGVTLRMATTDTMEGGRDAARIEIVNHGTLEMDGITGMWVKATSAATVPTKNDWYGVVVASDAFGTNVSETEASYALFGARLETNNHIIKNFEAYKCGTGVYVEGGAPEVRNVLLHDNDIGLNIVNSTPKIYDLVAHHNSSYGLYVSQADGTTRTINVDGCMLYGNPNEGGHVYQSSGAITFGLNRCTIHGNGSHGFELYRTVNNAMTLNLTNSSITSNGGYGLYGSNSYYTPTTTWSNTNNWGNTSGASLGITMSGGTGTFSYNPLFKDAANGDFTPTDRSPLRCGHQDAVQAAGYKPFVGDPTGQLMGYLHGDMTLTAAGSPYVIPGDLIVDNKCSTTPVTLTIQAGTVLQFAAKADAMGGGVSAARTELRVLDNLVMDGVTAQVALTTGATAPAKGDWTGVVLETGSTVNARGYLVEWADNGFRGVSTTGNVYGAGVVRNASSWGYTFSSGANGTWEDGLITLNGQGGISLANLTGTPVIRRNIVLDNGSYDVYVADGSVQLFNNVLMGSNTGFYGYKSTGTTVITFDLYNNTIHEHAAECIHTVNYGSSANYMKLNGRNNLMTWSTGWAFLDDGSYRIQMGTIGWNYNNVYKTANYTAANPYSGINKGANDTAFDPQYEDIDPSGRRRWYDLRLLSISPMVDAGTSGGLIPTEDLIKTARPKVTKWDIGAYEYDPAVNHDPWAAAGADLLVAQEDVTCFDASATTDLDSDAMTYAWTFGDGQGAAGKFVCHTFTNNIVHEVILTVTDEHGGVDHDVLAVDVDRRPIAEAGPEVFAAAGGDAAAFDGSQSRDVDGTVTAYSWDFGDGSPLSTVAKPSHQYSAGPSKDFLVTLTVTDNDGFSSSDTTIAHVYGTTDTNGPLIVHTAIANGRPEGQAVDINATISDPSGVQGAKVYYRSVGAASWTTMAMTLLGGTSYKATIPSAAVTAAGVQYYIEATDSYATPNTGTLPATAPVAVFTFTVNPVDNLGPTIVHTPIANGQAEGRLVAVGATVTDASGVATVKLYYRVGGGSAYGNLSMSTTGDGVYAGAIPAEIVTATGVDYYIEATDQAPAANKSTAPLTAPGVPYHFSVNVTDTAGPTIVHTAVANGQLSNNAVTILADITDLSGVQSANLFYRVTAGSWSSTAMSKTTGNTYSAQIPAGMVTTAGVQYYLYAQDNSAAHNASLAPATAPTTPYAFTVTSGDTSGPSIAHTAVANGQVAGAAVTIAAAVVDGSGVASVTLYYRILGAASWTIQAMSHGTGDSYQGVIPADQVTSAGVQYYLRAVDASTASNASVAPVTAPGTPYGFTVKVEDRTGPDVAHTPVRNGQIAGSPVTVTATVTDASGVNSVTLYYRAPGGSYTTAPMSLGATDTYSATIPGTSVATPSVEYYLVAIDNSPLNNQSIVPSTAPTTPYAFTVTPQDLAGPTITHTPIADGQVTNRAVAISATVTDGSSVASVQLLYRVQGAASWTTIAMSVAPGDTYTATIPAVSVTTAGVEYYIRATDASSNANVSVLPTTAPTTPYRFTGVLPDTTGPVITHTPIANGRTANVAVTVAATVSDVSGVASVKLYFKASNAATYAIVDMAVTTGTTWQADIPAFAVTTAGVDYYLLATDLAGAANTSTSPANAPTAKNTFTVLAVDNTAPLIAHVPIAAGRPEGVAVAISAAVSDASGIAGATLWYRTTGSGAYASVAMTDGNADGVYDAGIPAGTVLPAGVDYYLTAVDASVQANGATLPTTAPTTPYHFTVTARDVTPPAIQHTPVANGQLLGIDVPVQANVVDAGGVLSVTLFYRATGSPTYASAPMVSEGTGQYAGLLPGAAITAAGVDYYLQAVDVATPANAAVAPVTAPTTPYRFTVKVPDTTGPSIVHTAVADGQTVGVDVAIAATITDASGIASATLWFRPTGSATFYSVALTAQGGNAYAGTIPGYAVTAAGVQYFLQAMDSAQPPNAAVLPAGAPTVPYAFTARASDTTGPTIAHTPITDGQTAGGDITIQATVADASGVGTVTLYYRTSGTTAFTSVTLAAQGNGLYSAAIPAVTVAVPGVDYYLVATDQAQPANTSVLPAGGLAAPFTFTVLASDGTGPTIDHTPVTDGQTAGGDITIQATVTDASGVGSVTLYYRTSGTTPFASATMAAQGGDLFQATIPAATVKVPGVDYYLVAADQAQPSNTSKDPAGAPGAPHSFTVTTADTMGPAIVHTPVRDAQLVGVDVAIQTTVTDPSGVTLVRVRYRVQGSPYFDSRDLVSQGEGLYAGAIPGAAVTAPGMDYYLEAQDALGNGSVAPEDGPGTPYQFTVSATDSTGPSILHTAIADGRPAGADLVFQATVTDPSGVSLVRMRYRVQGEPTFGLLDMASQGGNVYAGTLPGAAVVEPAMEYYIEAQDGTPAGNGSVAPDGAPGTPYHFTVIVLDNAGPTIDHDPLTGNHVAGMAVPVTAIVTDPSGVAAVRMYFRPTGTADFAVTAMTAKGGNVWEGTVPAYAVTTPGVDYTLEAVDASAQANVATSPGGAPATFHAFPVIVLDTVGPVIDHTPLSDGQMAGAAVLVLAAVTDASGVATVTLSYRAKGTTPWFDVEMTADGDLWSAEIPGTAMVPAAIEYFLTAADLADPSNTALDPKWGAAMPYSFTVVTVDGAGPSLAVTAVADDRPVGKSVTVQATAQDPSGIHAVTLFYRQAGSTDFTAVPMAATTDVQYQGKIPAEDVTGTGIEYYVLAVDDAAAANTAIWPATAPETPASFTLAAPPDAEGPTVVVDTIRDEQPVGVDVVVTATVTDASGVGTVTLFYRTQGTSGFTSVTMAAGATADTYQATIPAAAVASPGVDYYVEALDQAATANKTVAPTAGPTGPYTFTVDVPITPDTTPPAIVHTPPEGTLYAGQAITLAATITDDSGIAAAVLHYQVAGGIWNTVDMTAAAGSSLWNGVIPAGEVLAGELRYYFEARDKSAQNNIGREPAGAPSASRKLIVVEKTGDTKSGGGCDAGSTGALIPTLLMMVLAFAALRRRTV